MENIKAFIQSNNEMVIFALAVVSILLLILLISSHVRIGKLNKKYNLLLKGVDSVNLEDMLIEHLQGVENVKDELQIVNRYCKDIDKRLKLSLQNVAVVRYNAFDDMGSDLSFSVAMLDDNLDGIVISSLYGRDGCSIYGKPIIANDTKYSLSKEELQVLKLASDKVNLRK